MEETNTSSSPDEQKSCFFDEIALLDSKALADLSTASWLRQSPLITPAILDKMVYDMLHAFAGVSGAIGVSFGCV